MKKIEIYKEVRKSCFIGEEGSVSDKKHYEEIPLLVGEHKSVIYVDGNSAKLVLGKSENQLSLDKEEQEDQLNLTKVFYGIRYGDGSFETENLDERNALLREFFGIDVDHPKASITMKDYNHILESDGGIYQNGIMISKDRVQKVKRMNEEKLERYYRYYYR